jgi:hypothetical protein
LAESGCRERSVTLSAWFFLIIGLDLASSPIGGSGAINAASGLRVDAMRTQPFITVSALADDRLQFRFHRRLRVVTVRKTVRTLYDA